MKRRTPLFIAALIASIFIGCSKHTQTAATAVPPKSIDMAHWRETPHMLGDHVATQEDVDAGLAVFAVTNDDSQLLDVKLPCCAIHTDQQTGKKTPVIVVQAEYAAGAKIIGYRFLNGDAGICPYSELELLDGPDARFKQ